MEAVAGAADAGAGVADDAAEAMEAVAAEAVAELVIAGPLLPEFETADALAGSDGDSPCD